MKIRILGTFIAVTLSLFGFAQGDIQNISAEEFNTQIEKNPGIILDVRTPAETAQGYIPDASFIDLYDPEFKAKVKLMQKDQPIYVYCRSGGRSAKAAKILIQSGSEDDSTTVVEISEKMVSVKDLLFSGIDIANLRYLPFHADSVEFKIASGEIDKNNVTVPVFEIKDTKPFSKERQKSNNPLKVGSIFEANYNGNWD